MGAPRHVQSWDLTFSTFFRQLSTMFRRILFNFLKKLSCQVCAEHVWSTEQSHWHNCDSATMICRRSDYFYIFLLECFQYYTVNIVYTYSNEVEATFLFFSLVLWMMVTIWTQFVPFDLSLSGAPPRLPVVPRLNMLVDNKFYLISPGQRPVSNQRSSWVEDVSTAAQSI